ncbi:MAG: PmoA family protein [Luteolibacter sp.]
MKHSAICLAASLSWSSALFAVNEVTAVLEGKQVVIRAGDKEILRYQGAAGELPRPDIKPAYIRGGYIQSIHTPAGRIITDDFAVIHLHHHGVWESWTKTEFEGRTPDFWNMGAETGRVEFVALDKVWQNDGKAGFQARHRFVDLTVNPGKVVLLETWDVTVSTSGGTYVIDLTSTQNCATDSPLKLPEYHYGGLGFRGNAAWNGVDQCHFLTASGLTDRTKVNSSREKWCWIGGKLDGGTCGLTILCHPQNFRFPQPIRAHPTEPFFCYAPQQAGGMEIVAGQKYISRYRLVIADGEPDAKAAEGWWEAYEKL